MKVKGLNNREYHLDLKKYIVRKNDKRKKSKYHILARNLIKEVFNSYSILEEVKLPGSRDPIMKSVLFLDFFVPGVMMGVEVHGEQHYKYLPFFHKTKAGYYTSLKRDQIKEEWCKLNGINLIILKYSDDIEKWRDQIERF